MSTARSPLVLHYSIFFYHSANESN